MNKDNATDNHPIGDCQFCEELQRGSLPNELQVASGLSHRLLTTETHAAVFPTVSPLQRGHLLVTPRRHVSSIAQCTDEEFVQIEKMADTYSEMLSAISDHVLIFEHGVGRGREGGCGITHAHLHLVPCQASLIQALSRGVESEIGECDKKVPLSGIRTVPVSDTYLWIGEKGIKGRLFVRPHITSQLVRRIFSEIVGRDYWNWRDFSDWPDVAWTVAHLHGQKHNVALI